MNLLSSLVLLGSLALTLGCSGPDPGATNIARNGEASQDSDYHGDNLGCAKKAIDGVKNVNYFKGFCAHNNGRRDPWWKVDLKKTYTISHVVITNRMDCCPQRLLGAEIRVGNSPDNNNPVCGTVNNAVDATLNFCCNGMEGQFISVVIPGRSEWLSLCEVEVYGELVTEDYKTCW
ncbi:fucolectin-like [Bufo gargarizans]|uniref:fucolectin-like n=1 Tax=Bufo gargarizans TaxID=30331 RepID=UPI001CF305A6|nr:fucolectin-like [Bufo gargarizans]